MFWSVKGADLKGGIFSGLKLKIGSLRSLVSGGVAFATPDKKIGQPVADNAQFNLNDSPKDEWLKWKPTIPITREAAPNSVGAKGRYLRRKWRR